MIGVGLGTVNGVLALGIAAVLFAYGLASGAGRSRPPSVASDRQILNARALFLVQSWSQSPTFDADSDSDSTPLHATTQQCSLTVDKNVNYTH